MLLYTLTDWLSLIPVGISLAFALLGLMQLIRRKSLIKVDRSLLVLGGFYIVMMMVYVIFEKFVINYRPILINEYLEPSYPSSTTMLVRCIMPTAMMQLYDRVKSRRIRRVIMAIMAYFTAFMVKGRLISGVHWLTEIVGGLLLSAGLVTMYFSLSK